MEDWDSFCTFFLEKYSSAWAFYKLAYGRDFIAMLEINKMGTFSEYEMMCRLVG